MPQPTQELVSELKGAGSLYQGRRRILDVNYEIRTYQQIHIGSDGTPIKGLKRLVARLSTANPPDLLPLVGEEFTLRLEDKRAMELVVRDGSGTVEHRSGIYHPSPGRF